MKLSDYLENYKLVENIYGYWPTFHDAEIKSVQLGSYYKVKEDYSCAYMELTVHCFEMTSKVKEDGYFELVKHHLIKFRFEDICDSELIGFNHQNAVLSLDFEVLETNDRGFTPILVEIDPAYGLGGEFKAYKASILDVLPCDSSGKLTSAL
jgi:hypothetical protein